MSDSVIYVVTITLLVALAFLAFWIARQSLGFDGMKLFQSKPRRLGLVETTAIDGRRRLLLIRRDNVEHLIMTGGPVDVVIETGIPLRHLAANGLSEALDACRAWARDRPPILQLRGCGARLPARSGELTGDCFPL